MAGCERSEIRKGKIFCFSAELLGVRDFSFFEDESPDAAEERVPFRTV